MCSHRSQWLSQEWAAWVVPLPSLHPDSRQKFYWALGVPARGPVPTPLSTGVLALAVHCSF